MKRQILMPRFPSRRTVMVSFLLAATAFGLLGMNPSPAHALSLYSIHRTQTGLVGSDPLNAQLSQAQLVGSSFWTFGGSAAFFNTPFAFNEDSNGLHIGVQSTAAVPFSGYYALHVDNAMLAHAVVTAPSRMVPSGYPNVGLYVQTGGPNVNYIECAAVTSSALTYWQVAMTTGNTGQAITFQPLFVDMSPNQPLTRDCTIVTNGQNFIAAYLDNSLVYQASNLNLGYQSPLQFFIETQTSYTGGMFYGTFQNFYLTSSDSIKVTNMPSGSTAQVVSPSGRVLASAAASSGTATLAIGQYGMPLFANIKVVGLLGLQIASTASPISIWGGDAYSLSLPLGLGGGLVGTGPGSTNSSLSIAVPTSTSIAPSAGGAVQGIAAPSSGGVPQVGSASSAAQASTPTGSATTVATAPLAALSLATALGRTTRRDPETLTPRRATGSSKESSVGQEGQC